LQVLSELKSDYQESKSLLLLLLLAVLVMEFRALYMLSMSSDTESYLQLQESKSHQYKATNIKQYIFKRQSTWTQLDDGQVGTQSYEKALLY
jgi:hypothetical protein